MTGLQSGQNVTLQVELSSAWPCPRFGIELILFAKQVVFLGGDGSLYQASEMAALLRCIFYLT